MENGRVCEGGRRCGIGWLEGLEEIARMGWRAKYDNLGMILRDSKKE
jgi:hypothetical protein